MLICSRNVIKSVFTIACVIVVLGMVGFWFYKYEIEDRDIGVVDYAPLQDANDIEFPVTSLCFKDPFVCKTYPQCDILIQTQATHSSIAMETYRQYLEGNVYDDVYENLEYSNLTLDLEKYFLSGRIYWQNETYDMNIADFIAHTEIFSGFYQSEFLKCFMIRYHGIDARKIKRLELYYNMNELQQDWYDLNKSEFQFYIAVHYPGQFLLGTEYCHINLNTQEYYQIFIEQIEILRRRNSRKRNCLEEIDKYDSKIIDVLLQRKKCRVPYLNGHRDYPKCITQKTIKDSKIDTRTPKKIGMPKACQRISKLRVNFQRGEIKVFEKHWNRTFTFWIDYPDEVKIITQSKDVDIHSLIGNIGGYLGLFLGN